ncbi:MAG: TIGR03862 family flavoprotein [Aeromonadaceae bacterium]
MPTTPSRSSQVAIIGGGPAGLMAAEQLAKAGISVTLFDAMPSLGRKFLQAGKGGMNLTHSEAYESFVQRYGERAGLLAPLLKAFGATELREWAEGLGFPTFVGSSGRVFPTDMKAAPLLRSWLHRLRELGVQMLVRHRWIGWSEDGRLRFATEEGELIYSADATLVALGGASWPRLGSTGEWVPLLQEKQLEIAPLQPSNCGLEIAWSPFFIEKFAGSPLKSVVLTHTNTQGMAQSRQGECVITKHGMEGSLLYPFTPALREQLAQQGQATFFLDLLPGRSAERVQSELQAPRGSKSLANHLRSRLGIEGVKAALLRECLPSDTFQNLPLLAVRLKSLPVTVTSTRPIAEAISTAGGVKFEELDNYLMVKRHPGLFCAGEMLDWEAPTGGYLLTGCFSTGYQAAQGIKLWLQGAR